MTVTMTRLSDELQLFTCKHCGKEAPASEFRGDKRKRHGIIYMCKECRRARMMENGEALGQRLRDFKKRGEGKAVLITVEQLEQLLTNHNCAYCGEQLTNDTATVDHIFSLSQDYGGCNIVENIVQACHSCNSSKADNHIADFYRRSDKFTSELWTEFVRKYTERLIKRPVTDIEVEQMKRNLFAEADDLRRNAAKSTEVANG